MICRSPQNLANFLGLYMVKCHGLWYGCRTKPEWCNGTWDLENLIEATFRANNVLYIGEDKDSLFEPDPYARFVTVTTIDNATEA